MVGEGSGLAWGVCDRGGGGNGIWMLTSHLIRGVPLRRIVFGAFVLGHGCRLYLRFPRLV